MKTRDYPLYQCLRAALLLLWTAVPTLAQNAPPLLPAEAVRLTAAADRSTLDRITGKLVSNVEIKAVNAAGQQIDGPVHAVVRFQDKSGAEVRAGIAVPGALGGFGLAPWQTPYLDLSAKVPGGWKPGQEITWSLNFARDRALTVTYEIKMAGLLNRSPQADAGGPYRITAGESAALTGTATDPDGDPLAFSWRFADGVEAAGAQAARTFSIPGVHEVTLTVTDGRGGEATAAAVVAVTPAGSFALGRTRVLDGNGHPLPAAEIRETGPAGARTFAASGDTAFASLGGVPGNYVWRFSAPGHFPVWRRATLTDAKVALIPSAWLASEADAEGSVSLLGPTTLRDAEHTVRLTFPAGAFQQEGRTLLVARPGQTLPAELPPGWSPLAAFSFYPPDPGAQSEGTAQVTLPSPLPQGRTAAVALYNRGTGEWTTLALLTGADSPDLSFPLQASGDYVLALPDAAPATPPPPALTGQPLSGVTAPVLVADSVTATGRVTPAERAASENPRAVTAAAGVDFSSSTLTLPSGLWFRMEMEETYDLRDGGRFRTPDYDATIFAWRGLVSPGAPAQLQAPFPMRPRLLLPGSILNSAHLRADILAPEDESLLVFSADGGQLTSGDVSLTVPAGAAGGLATAQLRSLPAAGFAGLAGGLQVGAAFVLDFANLMPGSVLGFSYRGKLDALADFVLARVVNAPGANGLQPVLRLRSDAAGFLSTTEPAAPPHLSGVDRAGQYVIVKLAAPQGLVSGGVRFQAGNAPAPAALVRISAQPWLAFTPADGSFVLLAPEGDFQLSAERTVEGFTGRTQATMPADLTPVSADVLIGSAPPFVVSTSPADAAVKVPTVTPVTITFSEPMAPAPFGAAGAVKLLAPDDSEVPAGLTLDLSGRTATLLPANPLAASTVFKIVLSPDLRDRQNLPLEGAREFTFTTAAPAARGIGAQLTIYEPGGAGPTPADAALINAIPGYTPGTDKTKVVAIGSAGSADPQVAVILVNESTGATATVLSKPDGSFANCIEAAAEDFISAVFVNAEGTRISIPASRQKFDDGRTGLFRQGGILEAENDAPSGTFTGPVNVGIPADAISDRIVFQIDPVPLPQLLTALDGSLPAGGTVVAGAIASHEGATGVGGRAQIEFVIDASKLTLPDGITRPEDMTFILTSVQEVDDVLVYEAIDTMAYVNGKLTSQVSPPDALTAATNGRGPRDLAGPAERLKNVAEGFFNGLTFPEIAKRQFLADVKAVLGELSFSSLKKMKQPNSLLKVLGLPGVQETVIHQLLLPIALAQGTTTNIGGRVSATKRDADGNPVGDLQFVAGALVALERPPVRPAGRLRPGEIVAQSNRDGQFMMRMDVGPGGAQYLIGATHPRYPGQRPFERDSVGTLMQRLVGNVPDGGTNNGISGANVSLVKLQFTIPDAPGTAGPDETPPSLRASHVPVLPAIGLDDDDTGASLTVAAVDTRDVAELEILLSDAQSFTSTPLVLNSDVKLEGIITLPSSGPRMEKRVTVKCARPGRVIFRLTAADAAGNRSEASYAIDFGRPPLVPDLGGEEAGPRVLSMSPADNSSGHLAFPEIRLRFSKTLPAAAFTPGNTDWLVFDPAHFLISLETGLDRREAVIRFAGLESGPVSLTVGSPLTDEAGHAFDQNPDEEDAQAFTANFALAAPPSAALDLDNGGGVGLLGGYLFALDRLAPGGGRDGKLVVYDVADPLVPVRVSETLIIGEPADLSVIPSWSFIPRPGDGPVTRPIVAVLSGEFGSTGDGNAGAGFKTLRVFDVSNPASPAAVARGNVSFDPTSKIAKMVAVPPFLVFQEQSADVTLLRIIDLAAFTLGFNATSSQRLAFPERAVLGTDVNDDGDFTDAGETYSAPARSPALFFGDFFSYAPETRDERLVDFSLAGHGLLGVITTRPAGGVAFYRNVLNGSDPGNPAVGSFAFQSGEDPKRVTILTGLPMRVAGQRRLMDVALISMRTGAAGKPALMVLDLTNPAAPRRLGQMPMEAMDGIPNTLVQREGATLVLATSTNTLTLDSERLLETDASGRSLAVKGRIAGFGGGVRSFVTDACGISAVASSGRNLLAYTGPSFDVVTFPAPPQSAKSISQLAPLDVASKLLTAEQVKQARKAAVTFEPGAGGALTVSTQPQPGDHYYVVCRVPGGAAGAANLPAELDLTLSSVSIAGGFPALDPATVFPRLLVDPASRTRVLPPDTPPADAYPVSLPAHRLSNTPTNPLYNVFLAGPFTLHTALGAEQAKLLTAQLPRAFLRLDKCIYAGLKPKDPAAGSFLSPYQPSLGNGPLEPGSGILVPCDYRRNPLIFVPGVMASKLRGNRSFDLWLSVPNLGVQVIFDAFTRLAEAGLLRVEIFGLSIPIPPQIPAAAADYLNALGDLVLGPNGEGKTVVASDVLRDVFAAGDSVPLERVQGPLLEYLQKELGYREYSYDRDSTDNLFALESAGGDPNRASLATLPDLYPFPYDWRLDNAKNAQRLAGYIDLIKDANPDVTNVDVIGHSMGGLVTRRYMLEHPGVVETFVSACSPFLGAPKAAATLKTGDLGELLLNFAAGLELGKQISRHMPALHQLMPTKGYYDLGGRPVAERGWDADRNGVAYETLDYSGYRNAMDGSYVHDPFLTPPNPIAEASETFHNFSKGTQNTQDDWRGENGGSRIYHIVSATQKPETISRLRLMPRLIPAEPVPDVSLELPPVAFEDDELPAGIESVLPPDSAEFPAGERTFRLEYSVEVDRGMGDGTVPLLSQVRGFGSPFSLNAPGTVMLPLVSRDPREDPDKLFSHAGMLKNPEFFALVRGILLGETAASSQPVLTLNVPSSASEGGEAEFSVIIAGAPPGATPTVVWDTGDGGFAIGTNGHHVWHEDGTYTVTCMVGFEKSPGAVLCKQVTVSNAPPVVTLSAESGAKPGEAVRIIASAGDLGGEDSLTYSWNLGDGTSLPEGAPFLVNHSYAQAGTFNVTVTVKDDDGATATASTAVSVGTGAPAPFRAPRGGGGFDEEDDAPPVEFVQLVIGGHDVLERATPRVVQSTTGLGGQLQDFVVDEATSALLNLRTVQVAPLGARSVEMRVYRLDPGGSASVPASTRIIMEAAAYRLDVRLQHHRASGIVKCYEWQVATEPGEEVQLKVEWDTLDAATDDELKAITDPEAFAVRRISCRDTLQPAIEADFDEVDYSLRGFDLALLSGPPQPAPRGGAGGPVDTLLDQRPVFTVESPADKDVPTANSPGGNELPIIDGGAVPEGSIATEIGGPVTRGTEPGGVSALASVDGSGNLDFDDEAVCRDKPKLTPEVIAKQKQEIFDIFDAALNTPDFQKMLIRKTDLLVLEQGSGGCLWKGDLAKCQAAFNPETSDRDLELFLPAAYDMKYKIGQGSSAVTLSPANSAHREAFEEMAHLPEVMRGNWYFRRPMGVDAAGVLMEEPPDPGDGALYTDFVSTVATWRYFLPLGVNAPLATSAATTVTLGRGVDGQRGPSVDPLDPDSPMTFRVVDIPKGAAPFDQPATPGEVLSFILGSIAEQRGIVHEANFFPFRREHFEFGVMSLEKPAPFGPDPLGDAGLGRGLLLLKWLLEGSFLPAFSGINTGVNDAARRGEILARLAARAEALEPEGYEWGLLQEFGLLKASAQFRVEKVTAPGTPGPVLGDYVQEHDKAILKKAGKAALRAVVARLAVENSSRPSLFAVSVPAYDADARFPTFEHFVADRARPHLNLFPGVTSTILDEWVLAKTANCDFLSRIARDPQRVDQFLQGVFELLAGPVDAETEDDYLSYRGQSRFLGRPAEVRLRDENVFAIERGFALNATSPVTGRLAMHNIAPPNAPVHKATYSFEINLVRRGTTFSGPLSVHLTSDDGTQELVCPDLNFPSGKSRFPLHHESSDGLPFFTLRRTVDAVAPVFHEFTINGLPANADGRRHNNQCSLQSYLLDIEPHLGPVFDEVGETRIVYRGLTLDPAGLAAVQADFALGRERSEARRAGVSDAQSTSDLVDALNDKFVADPNARPSGFRLQDVAALENDIQKAALAHTAVTVGQGGVTSVCISASEGVRSPYGFANVDSVRPLPDSREAYLLVYEVPKDYGFRFLPTARQTSAGRTVMKRINPEESPEVVYFGDIKFRRAWIYRCTEQPPVFLGARWSLVNEFTGAGPTAAERAIYQLNP